MTTRSYLVPSLVVTGTENSCTLISDLRPQVSDPQAVRLRARPGALFSILFGVFFGAAAQAQQSLRPEDAAKYVGQTTVVCGRVAGTFYDAKNPRGLTVLNLVRPYPDHVFSVIIWGKDRSKFQVPPERAYREKTICVSGLISSYKGRPQIVVEQPDQLQLQSQ